MLISRHGFRAFTEYDLNANLENFLTQLRKEIEADTTLATADEEAYIQQKVAAKILKGIEFDTSNITLTQREEQIPARYFPDQFFMRGERSSYPKPVITFHVPFSGDKQFLHFQPTTRLMVSEEVSVDNSHVLFDVVNFSNDADQVAKERDGVVRHLTEQAGYLNKDIAAYNSRLESFVREAVRGAKVKFKDQSGFLDKLGNKPKNE